MRLTIPLTIIALILSFTAHTQVPAYVPSQGLLAWYSFNGNSQDLSGNNNHLVNNNATLTTDRFGVPSSAYSFNGSTSYLINSTPTYIMADTSSFTVSIWVTKPTSNVGVFLMHGSTVNGNFIYNLQGTATFSFGTNKQGAAWYWAQTSITLNTWEHFVGVYQNKNMKLYKNGVQVATNTYAHTGAIATLLPFYVGRGVSGSYTNGTLDDIGVWGRALSPGEIWDMYMACSGSLITSQPQPVSAGILSDALFTLSASAGAGYQWQVHDGSGIYNDLYDGGQYNGALTDSLTISDLTLLNDGTWLRCLAFEGTCVDTSDEVMLTVNCIPGIGVQPLSQTVATWTTATFQLSVVDPQVGLQWQKKSGSVWNDLTDAGQYSGTQTAGLMVSSAQAINNGEQYRCVADLLGCMDTSDVVTLTVSPQVGIPDADALNSVSVYPSPTDGLVHLELAPAWLGASYTIFDGSSRQVASGEIDKVHTLLHLGHLSPGTYILKLSGPADVARIVVVR